LDPLLGAMTSGAEVTLIGAIEHGAEVSSSLASGCCVGAYVAWPRRHRSWRRGINLARIAVRSCVQLHGKAAIKIGFRCMWHLHRRWRATTAPRQCAWWLHIQKTSCCCPLPRGLLIHAIANAHVTNSESQPSLLLSYAAEHERTTIRARLIPRRHDLWRRDHAM
jgi:hypothetical protein